ncbi:uncharacterized protein METZ01_LOCUS188611, partial [marine metagenome]
VLDEFLIDQSETKLVENQKNRL